MIYSNRPFRTCCEEQQYDLFETTWLSLLMRIEKSHLCSGQTKHNTFREGEPYFDLPQLPMLFDFPLHPKLSNIGQITLKIHVSHKKAVKAPSMRQCHKGNQI